MASAAILIGGAASRFGGRDKGALIFGGRTILEHQLEALAPLTDDVMIVGGQYPAAIEHWPRHVPDRLPGSGPLAGLDAALESARDDELVLLACDMPFVTTGLLRHLVNLAGDADAVVPVSERGYHPLCAVYTRACRAVVARHLAENRLAIKSILERLRVRLVSGEELDAFGNPDRLLANVNTLADYQALESLQGHHG